MDGRSGLGVKVVMYMLQSINHFTLFKIGIQLSSDFEHLLSWVCMLDPLKLDLLATMFFVGTFQILYPRAKMVSILFST